MSAVNPTKTPRSKTPRKRKLPSTSDPVEVYCRIRPADATNDELCIKALSDTHIQLTPSETSNASKNHGPLKELQYAFQKVFDETSAQKAVFDQVALPLVDDLLKGKNGLLFTYGITSSGKTHTMSGLPNDQGIHPRCFDVIFNSVVNRQATKYIFKPDKDNWFEIQSEADAMTDRQKNDILPGVTNAPKTPAKNRGDVIEIDESTRCRDPTTISDIEEDNLYSVFVSCVEIYNNNIYDLLEDLEHHPILGCKPPTSKTLREDVYHNMYVHQVTEIEVTNPTEAFMVLYQGKKRRRVAHTALNAKSSRSHSVFNIRVVQAPLDPIGKDILRDPSRICVSQLSLVDLAGSERCKRTNNTGDRLKEAGSINQDLMALRSCIESLRENQTLQSNKMVPFRNTRLTHLFKNFFEGEGKVRMIVCVNPIAEDYDETVQVMKFAELTQEIMITRSQNVRFDTGLTPGRGKQFKDMLDKAPSGHVVSQEIMITRSQNVRFDTGLTPGRGKQFKDMMDKAPSDLNITPPSLVYSLGPSVPTLVLADPSDLSLISNLIAFLDARENTRDTLLKDLTVRREDFRSQLVDMEEERTRLRERNREIEASNRTSETTELRNKRKIVDLQKKFEDASNELQWSKMEIDRLEHKLKDRDIQIRQDQMTRGQMKANFNAKIQQTKQQCGKTMEEERKKLDAERQTHKTDETPRKGHVSSMKRNYVAPRPMTPAKSDSDVSQLGLPTRTRIATRTTTAAARPVQKFPLRSKIAAPAPPIKPKPAYNLRHRRSKSQDTWIDHRPENVMLDGLYQPKMTRKRSVTNLSNKDTREGSKYCLTTQQADTDGELETKFYKGDMLTTVGGGTAVVFNDLQVVRQESPGDRKRKSSCPQPEDFDGDWTDTEDRCKYAIEHHGKLKRLRATNV